MTKKPYRRRCIPVLCAVLLTLAGLLSCSPRFPRLEVGGFRITEAEYLRAMYQARNDVLSDHAAISHSLLDWSAETPLGDPRELTMERTLALLREYYAEGTLAVERGYLADAGYDAMVQQMEQINGNRQEALDSGAVVSGFASFTVDDYISYRAASLRLQFCSDPRNPETQVTPEELQQRYESDRDSLYQQPDSMELSFVVIDFPSDEQEQALLQLRELAMETGDLAAAVAEQPLLQNHYRQISVDPGTYSAYERTMSDILFWADALQPGELSPVHSREGRLCLIQCISRTDHSYVPLEAVQSVVEQSVRESRYDALLAERAEAMELRGDLKELYRYTAQQLP